MRRHCLSQHALCVKLQWKILWLYIYTIVKLVANIFNKWCNIKIVSFTFYTAHWWICPRDKGDKFFQQISFLRKIQNRTSRKTGEKIVLLHAIWIFNLEVVVFPSNFWKTTIIWHFFRVILNFAQECYYLKNKVGVVDFTKARGVVKFQSPRALRVLGL